jgi:hypothetical protein
MVRKGFLVILVLLLPATAATAAQPAKVVPPPSKPQFVYCAAAQFANCTKALCKPKGKGYSCKCFLDDRFSATSYTSTCKPATKSTAQSRFHPIESYQECTNPRTDTQIWAWCLGVSCKISKDGEVKCDCTAIPANVPPLPYIVTTNTFLPDACKTNPTGEVWSSATPGDVSQITSFLQKQPGLGNLTQPVVLTKKK